MTANTATDATAGAIAELERLVGEAASQDEIVLPPYPGVALRVERALATGEFSAADVARIVGSDNALAADVLRCANSAYYRRGAPVTSLTQAVARVGARQVLKLAFTCVLAGQAQASGALVALRRRVWIEGLASAALAQELGRLRGIGAEEAFTLGLLHDFGKVVTIWRLESLLERDRLRGAWPLEVWSALAERQHVALGVALAGRWKLPAVFAEVIAAHHGAGPCSSPELLDVIRTCDRVVALLVNEIAVDAGALAAIPTLSDEEQAALGAVVADLPGFVSAFDAGAACRPTPAPRTGTPHVVASAEPADIAPIRTPIEAWAHVGARSFSCTVVGVGPNALLVVSADPLPHNRLARVELPAEGGRFELWMLPGETRETAEGGHRVELRPFALGAGPRERWSALVATAARGA